MCFRRKWITEATIAAIDRYVVSFIVIILYIKTRRLKTANQNIQCEHQICENNQTL